MYVENSKIENLVQLCTILVVIIVKSVSIRSFLFCCLLYNHSFKTNPNSVTNRSKLLQLRYTYFLGTLQNATVVIWVGGHVTADIIQSNGKVFQNAK